MRKGLLDFSAQEGSDPAIAPRPYRGEVGAGVVGVEKGYGRLMVRWEDPGFPPIGEEEEEVMSMSIDEIDEAYSPGGRSRTDDHDDC